MNKRSVILLIGILFFAGATSGAQVVPQENQQPKPQTAKPQDTDDEAGRVHIAECDDGFEIAIDGELFTRYLVTDEAKPMLYPLYGPGQVPMTRNFPMDEVEGEQDDHPHHKSVWIGQLVNKHVDFWTNRSGVIQHAGVELLEQADDTLVVNSNWLKRDDRTLVCKVQTTMRFGWDQNARWIDFTYVFDACSGDLKFRDSKEGFFAIRSHPDLRLTPAPKKGVKKVFGQAINSEGVKGKKIWGKAAKWVNYWGPVDGNVVGFAIFDHPENFRHPTLWHARDYGLVAANPFGLHDFTGAKKGTGDHTLPENETITFRYRLLLHEGDHESANIEERYQAFAVPTE